VGSLLMFLAVSTHESKARPSITMVTGESYSFEFFFLSRAQILITISSASSNPIAFTRSEVKLAIPHFFGGKVLIKRTLDCRTDTAIIFKLFNTLKRVKVR